MLPREKIVNYGVDFLSNDELLAVIIGSGVKGENVFDLSSKIIKEDSLKNLLDLTYEDLININGIKKAKACKIIASIELAKRIFNYFPTENIYNKPEVIYNYLKSHYLNKTEEELVVLYLDSKLSLISKKIISIGDSGMISVDPFQIFKNCYKCNSSSIILVHNHPSNNIEPSQADIDFTENVKIQANLLGICIVDHIIIGMNGFYSFCKNGLV